MHDIYRSATVKLTAWYVVLVMAISLVFSGVVYHFATDTLAKGLSTQQERIYQEFPVFYGNPFFVHDSDLDTGAHRILLNLAYFNGVVLVASAFASYWLARRTLRPIEEANEQQKRFVADASHELRTPVTALKMSTEVALMDSAAPKSELRAALTSNLEEADKLETLLNSLLRLSHLESRGEMLTMSSVPAPKLIAAAIKQTSAHAMAKHITVTDKSKPLHILGDEASLVQLLVILLDNAIKYSPGESTVEVGTQQTGGEVAILVTDHGIGIAPEALEHVFDRFYRADKARQSNNGFGLGLAIAKHIADLHGGTITISSAPNKGTVVAISLPAAKG